MNALFVNGSMLEQGLQAFCWMLVHSLWQGLLLALLGGIVMLLTKKARATTRYTLLTGLLFVFLVSCLVTFIIEWNSGDTTGTNLSMTGALGSIAMLEQYGVHQLPAILAQFCSDNAALIVGIWFVVFVLKCCQMGWAFGYVHRVRTRQLQEPDHYWKDKMTVLTAQLQIKRTVGLLESGITKIPVVIGHLKPMIYMPVGLLANLPADQVEAVLLHELAHIRRHDYLVNLVQHIASIIFFFNPGLLWISSLIKQEREHCCDDVALAHTGNKKQFIQALISFKEQVVYGRTYAMAFPGKKSHLIQRVTRIIQNRNNSLSGGEKIFMLASLIFCFLLLGTLANRKTGAGDVLMHGLYAELFQDNRPIGGWTPPPAKEKKTVVQQQSVASTATARTEPIKKESIKPKTNTPARQMEADKQSMAMIQEPPGHAFVEPTWPVEQPVLSQAEKDRAQSLKDQEQAEHDKKQAVLDRLQADRDREQAGRDRLQAIKDREQAEKDRIQADKDRYQAVLDRQQAERDKAQAELDRKQADRDRAQAEIDRKQADKDRAEAERNRIQSGRIKATTALPAL
jgi:beta-lactamase regulating signal transducer with metallopeptidase domain